MPCLIKGSTATGSTSVRQVSKLPWAVSVSAMLARCFASGGVDSITP